MSYDMDDVRRDLDRAALNGHVDQRLEYDVWREQNAADQSRLEAEGRRRWEDEQQRAMMTLRVGPGGQVRTVAYDEAVAAQRDAEVADAWEATRPWNLGRATPVEAPKTTPLAAGQHRGRTIDLSSPDTQGLDRLIEADRQAHPDAYPPDTRVRGVDSARSAAFAEIAQRVGDYDPACRGASWRRRQVERSTRLVDPYDQFTPSDGSPHTTMEQAAELDPGFLELARKQFPELYLKTGD